MGEERYIDDPMDCAFIEMKPPKGWQEGKSDREANRHRALVREAGIRLPYAKKVDHALKVLRSASQRDGVVWAVSYSGGKDSTVASFLAEKVMGRLPHVYADTRLEYAATRRTIASRKGCSGCDLHIARSSVPPISVWREGLPLFSKEIASKIRQFQNTGNEAHLKKVPEKFHAGIRELTQRGIRVSEKCCDVLKKTPMRAMDKRLGITGHITGVRAVESRARKLGWLERGALYYSARNKMWLCHPLIYWTAADIARCIRENHLVIETPPLRGSGCVCCAFGAHIASSQGKENAIQHLYRTNRKMWTAFVENTRLAEAMDVLEIPCRES
jgi:3'-phosphoadenosine 5'-phosphosulfate sulfotransferase (PAPS reductase)/FAD synthetase